MENHTPFGFRAQGQGTERSYELLARKEQAAREVSLELAQRLLQESLEAEVTQQLGERRGRRSSTQVTWHCRQCKTRTQLEFRRNGHYRRGVTVREGAITVRMPLVRCRCGGYVAAEWQTLAPRERYWLDAQLDSIRRYLSGVSYRLGADAASVASGTQVSHLQGWRTMQGAGEKAKRAVNPGSCPRSVILDEVCVRVGGEPAYFLLAVADDGRILALDGPMQRTTEKWVGVLDWLSEHGIRPEAGLVGVTADGDSAIREAVGLAWPGIVLQQCVWHIEERVREEVTAACGRESPEVARVVQEVGHVFLADPKQKDSFVQAKERLKVFVTEHAGKPWVGTVERAFWEGTAYLRTPGLQRTNGAAERTIKELRRRIKTMDGFKSDDGGRHFAWVWIQWHNLRLHCARERAQHTRRAASNLKIPPSYPKLR